MTVRVARTTPRGRRGPPGPTGAAGPETGRFGVVGDTITDWDDAVDCGYYRCAINCANAPNAVQFFGHVKSFGANWIEQIVEEVTASASYDLRSYRRVKRSGTWTAWKQFAHINNIGVPLESSMGFTLEEGKHRLVANDGGGNFSLRIGHDFGVSNPGAYTCTETGYPGIIQYNQSNGQMIIGSNYTTSLTEGDTYSPGIGYLAIFPNAINYNSNSVWHAGNDGPGSGQNADLLDGYEATYFQVASDESIKSDIRPIEDVHNMIMSVRINRYEITDPEWSHVPEIGVIAQQLEEIFPEFVYESGGKKLVHYGPLCSVLFKGYQELSQRLELLEARLND